MPKVTIEFIKRNLLPSLSFDFLVDLHKLCCLTVGDFCKQDIARPDSPENKQEVEQYKRNLANAINACINYHGFGIEKERNDLNSKLLLLQVCSADDASCDLRDYAESIGLTIDRKPVNGVEVALAHLLAGHIDLLKQVKQLFDIKKSKSYFILPPSPDFLTFPIAAECDQSKQIKECVKYLNGILQKKGINPVCGIEFDRLSKDYWFTIKRSHYSETRSVVDSNTQEIEDKNQTPGNRDLVIYRSETRCLYVSLEVNAKLKWLISNYAIIVGRILFGFDIWEMKNRYTMDVFRTKSFSQIEEVASLVPGIEKVVLYRLNIYRPLDKRVKGAREITTIGYTGVYKSVTELRDANQRPVELPRGFLVERAYMWFKFDHGPGVRVSLSPEKNGLELENEQYDLIDRFLELAGFDTLYNRNQHGS